MWFLLVLYTFSTFTLACQTCSYNGGTYNCGAEVYMQTVLMQCCNGSWQRCHLSLNKWYCNACGPRYGDLANYSYTNDGVLFTQYLSLLNGQITHSSQLKIGDTIKWPESVIPIKIQHWNVTDKHANCCWSWRTVHGCVKQYCCGSHCCC